MYAIGIIEVVGFVASVEALDAMVKTSDVEFFTAEKKLGGRLVSIIVKGDIASVQSAVDIGIERASKLGKVAAHAVIPNPHSEVVNILNISALKFNNLQRGEIDGF
jgi:microcompartment protein CcmL/EutN